jgi:predicted phosphodiesterase
MLYPSFPFYFFLFPFYFVSPMRIAILSDIHSNIEALTKAFDTIDQSNVDAVYCLGDIVGYGARPNECVDIIRQRASKVVLGNHDLAAVDTEEARYFTRHGRTAAEWTNKILTDENRQFLSKLPYRDESKTATLVHANPEEPEHWAYIVTLEDAEPQFAHFKSQLCFIGHSHIPFVCSEDLKSFELRKDVRFLINVGSVGQPRDGHPELSFGILDTGKWTYQNVRVAYDIKSAAQAILDNGLPQFLADRLFRGV